MQVRRVLKLLAKRQLVICMPVRDQLEPETAMAVASITLKHALYTEHGLPVDEARNRLVRRAAAQNSEFVAWIDADCWFEPGAIETMLDLLKRVRTDVVVALCGGRVPFSSAIAYRGRQPVYEGRDFNIGETIRIDWAGLHCVVHRTDLLRRIGVDPFTPETDDLGEDFAFFRRVREHGGSILLDTSVVAAHIEGGKAFVPGRRPGRIVGCGFEFIDDPRDDEELSISYAANSRQRVYGPRVFQKRWK